MKDYKQTLSGTFYAPKFENVYCLTHDLLDSNPGYDILPWSDPNSLWNEPAYLAGALIMLHYPNYCSNEYGWRKGKINMRQLLKVCKEVAGFMRMENYLLYPRNYGLRNFISDVEIEEEDVIGYATLSGDFNSADNDPYETAGGYRKYVANPGTKVIFKLDDANKIYAVVPSSLVVDHYNNNFFGKSTGNGTKTYNVGEYIENRTVMIGYDIKQLSDKLTVENVMFDFTKAGTIAKYNIEKLKETASTSKFSVQK